MVFKPIPEHLPHSRHIVIDEERNIKLTYTSRPAGRGEKFFEIEANGRRYSIPGRSEYVGQNFVRYIFSELRIVSFINGSFPLKIGDNTARRLTLDAMKALLGEAIPIGHRHCFFHPEAEVEVTFVSDLPVA